MNREEQIKAIYKKIADNTLSFGCWVIVEKFVRKRRISSMVYTDDKNDMDYFYTKEKGNVFIEDVIGHPVMIGDILDYIEKNIKGYPGECDSCGLELSYDNMDGVDGVQYYCGNEKCDMSGITVEQENNQLCAIWNLIYEKFNKKYLWENKRQPIENQSDECIDYIYNLIK